MWRRLGFGSIFVSAKLLQVSQIRDLQHRWLRFEPWKRWCHSLLLKITEGSLSSPPADHDLGESPAFEVDMTSSPVLKIMQKNYLSDSFKLVGHHLGQFQSFQVGLSKTSAICHQIVGKRFIELTRFPPVLLFQRRQTSS